MIIAFVFFFFLPLSAHAIEFTGTGLTGTLEYMEPTENDNADRTPLEDLDRTEYRTGNDVDGMGEWVVVPATSPNGGGLVSIPDVTIPLPAGEVETLGRVHARACDDAGQRGANASDNCSGVAETTVEIDTLPPSGVQ